MIDADGVEALSMRKLGQALGRDPMRVYRHTKNKAALLDAVSELVLEDIEVPVTVDGDWESAVRAAAHSLRTTALAHPRMVLLLIGRPLTAPVGGLRWSGLQWLEGVLAILTRAGFDDEGVLRAYRFFTAFLAGHVLHEVQDLLDGDQLVDIQLALELLPEEEFTRIRALAPGLAARNSSLEFLVALDILLLGLRQHLRDTTKNTTANTAENT